MFVPTASRCLQERTRFENPPSCFRCFRKATNGKSLNDVLTTGAALHSDLISVVMNWRLHRFVFSADIEKMFRRIRMHPDDAEYQRILWRDNTDSELKT